MPSAPAEVDAACALIARGAAEIVGLEELRAKIAAGKILRVKAGFDPTAPDLHLGHAVLLAKMRHFQDLGHTAIFLIGDFTAMIGDPSGQNAARPPLSADEIRRNAATYKDQVFKILDESKTEVRRNAEWLGKMSAADLIRLAAQGNVARMMERNDFAERYRAGRTISIHEFLYPLMQARDSVELQADVELGGIDQKFNLLAGRELQKRQGQSPQSIVMTPLLEGLDGRRKMSKSFGNYIGVNEAAADIYGKLMSVSDELMWRYFTLLSRRGEEEIERLKAEADGGRNPMEIKQLLAFELTARFAGEDKAKKAREDFNERFRRRKVALPDIPDASVAADDSGQIPLAVALRKADVVASTSEARRKIREGAVYPVLPQRVGDALYGYGDGGKITDVNQMLKRGDKKYFRVGSRRYVRLIVT